MRATRCTGIRSPSILAIGGDLATVIGINRMRFVHHELWQKRHCIVPPTWKSPRKRDKRFIDVRGGVYGTMIYANGIC